MRDLARPVEQFACHEVLSQQKQLLVRELTHLEALAESEGVVSRERCKRY